MKLVTVRGIGEPLERNMLSQVVRHFPNTEHVELMWSAVYGPVNAQRRVDGESFAQATEYGEYLLRAELDKGPCLVVGYSGGAEVAGNIAARGHRNLVATVLVADPSAPWSDNGCGIRGPRNFKYPQPVRWVSNPDDIICCCPWDSPLRIIAETSEAFSLGDPAAWGISILSKLTQQKFWDTLKRPFNIIGIQRRYEAAYEGACLYLGRDPRDPFRLGRNAHTDYNLDDASWWLARQKQAYERNNA